MMDPYFLQQPNRSFSWDFAVCCVPYLSTPFKADFLQLQIKANHAWCSRLCVSPIGLAALRSVTFGLHSLSLRVYLQVKYQNTETGRCNRRIRTERETAGSPPWDFRWISNHKHISSAWPKALLNVIASSCLIIPLKALAEQHFKTRAGCEGNHPQLADAKHNLYFSPFLKAVCIFLSASPPSHSKVKFWYLSLPSLWNLLYSDIHTLFLSLTWQILKVHLKHHPLCCIFKLWLHKFLVFYMKQLK